MADPGREDPDGGRTGGARLAGRVENGAALAPEAPPDAPAGAPAGPAGAQRARADLLSLFDAAVAAAMPDGKFAGRLPARPRGRTIVIGAGKAAARMAAEFERVWGQPCEGMVVTRHGHGAPTRFVRVVEASHPMPDADGLAAAEAIHGLAASAGADDLVVFLLSGGASALLVRPAPGIDLATKQGITRRLLRSGAPITSMNKVRRSLSSIKGGWLAAAAAPARIVTYVISDVPGDHAGDVGSGPSIHAPHDPEAVFDILDQYGIEAPAAVRAAIRANRLDPAQVPQGPVHVIATPKEALDAAARRARELGLEPMILSDVLEGEAREVGIVMAGIVRSILAHGEPAARPCALLSGGETSVTVRGSGRGGRNAEFLLSMAYHLREQRGVSALACDTDGIDGSEDNAGAWFHLAEPDAALLREARAYLADNDAYGYFHKRQQLIITGPTRTNVNDFRAVILR